MTGPPKRVAILGGGIAGLTAAYWLSSTDELRSRYQVTVHQLGWRLGGKLASGRRGANRVNVEHGLHVWFGCYDNSFATMKDVYAAWETRPDGFPFGTIYDAFDQQSYTPMGEVIDGRHAFFNLTWPTLPGRPGEPRDLPEARELVGKAIRAVLDVVERLERDHQASFPNHGELPTHVEEATKEGEFRAELPGLLQRALHIATGEGALEGTTLLLDGLRWLLAEFHREAIRHADAVVDGNVDAHFLRNALDIGLTCLKGVLNPRYGIVHDWNLDRIDHLDLREWLLQNGGRPDIVRGWSCIKVLYDTMFQYREGRLDQPSYAAGTALRALIRIAMTYRGSVLYLVRAGMGEAVIAPIYELLAGRGVEFCFFHKVSGLALSQGKDRIAQIEIEVQAKTKDGPYRPTIVENGLVTWGDHPDWDQLKEGDRYRQAAIDFESAWDQPPPEEQIILREGEDFDIVVLAIALGSYKQLNHEPRLADELIAADPGFASMTRELGLVPSIGVQLWLRPPLPELGWTTGRPAAVSWTYPNDVWAEMTPVMASEGWRNRPGSLHYLCGVLPTGLYLRPWSEPKVPEAARAIALNSTRSQLAQYTNTIWPEAVQDGGSCLDWALLVDPEEGDATGPARLATQVIKANVTPTECCVGSHAGSTRYRSGAKTAFQNLYICGEVARTGLNSTCVEASVMSGMAAARAICGVPGVIAGEGFLGPPFPG
jgi:uncharacterized protein with NAD-binding domain and iron-sulfur cluster